jgi:transmembrane protein TMEM220
MLMRISCIGAALLFLGCVAVQFNDPDPLRWMAIYGAAAVLSLAALRRGGIPWIPTAVVGGIALAWMLSILPRVIGRVSLAELFGRFEMKTITIEEARECVGLGLVTAWMAVLAAVSLRARRGPAPTATSQS